MARTIEISDETFEKLKLQLGEDCYKDITSLSDMVGEKFYFRTVTYHLTGRVKKVIGSILELENAAWIADSGRFMNAIKEGKLSPRRQCQLRIKKWIGVMRWWIYYWKQDSIGREQLRRRI